MLKVIYVVNTSKAAAFKYAHPRSHPEPVTLYVFDYCLDGSGNILIYEGWTAGAPAKPTRRIPIKSFRTLSDVYDTITSIGGTEPGTVSELHFFTHGTPECGVTSMPYGESTRAEFERVLKKGTERGDLFAAGFSRPALIKLWGCGWQPDARELTLSYWRTNNKTKRRTIQQRIEARIRGMYAFRLSELLDRTVWASPPGWKSSMDLPPNAPYIDYWDAEFGPQLGSMWWRVAPEFAKGAGAQFYSRVLNAYIDPVGYVGINDAMSKAPEPPEMLRAEATDMPSDDMSHYPAQHEWA